MRRPLLVVYDVTDDARRERLRAALRLRANWIQQSAWVWAPTLGVDSDLLLRTLRPLLGPGDRLRVYQPCRSCLAATRWAPPLPEPFGWWRAQVV